MSLKVDLTGFQQAIRDITGRLNEAVGESTLRSAGVAGAAVFRDEAKRNALANKKTGVLYENIIIKRVEEESDGARRQTYLVTVRSGKYGSDGDAFYWRFVEFGHRFVRPNPNKYKGRKKAKWAAHRQAAQLEYGSAKAPAYPFMRPAYESKKAEAAGAVQAELSRKIKEKLEGQ